MIGPSARDSVYGTILVDLEHGKTIDILDDRAADTLVQWLKRHPGIEIVSRDRSQTYADAITEGAPEAIQVADRWHLLKNLSEAVFKILQQEYDVIKNRLDEHSEEHYTYRREELIKREMLTPAEERRKERMGSTHQLLNLGWTQKRVARHLHIHPKTVRRYRRYPSPKSRRHQSPSYWIASSHIFSSGGMKAVIMHHSYTVKSNPKVMQAE